MANTETDLLQLVEILPVRGTFGHLEQNSLIAEGFSIEIFRRGYYIGSILSKDGASLSDARRSLIKLGVRDGDTLCRVNLATKLLALKGTFTTADHYAPSYEVVVEISVVNPQQFASSYMQQRDPVRICQVALEGELRRYAALRTHDRLKRDELSYRVEHTLNVGNNKTIGMDIIRVHDVDISIDEQSSAPIRAVKIFYCYAHEDRNLRDQLDKHMEVLRRSGKIVTWHDREILAGAEWRYEIDIHLKTSEIVLLLISPDFIQSDYCYSIELQQALHMHRNNIAHIIPIIVRPVDWQETPLNELQVLPPDGRPIAAWRNRDEALQIVVQEIHKVVNTFLERNRRHQAEIDLASRIVTEKMGMIEPFMEPSEPGTPPWVHPRSLRMETETQRMANSVSHQSEIQDLFNLMANNSLAHERRQRGWTIEFVAKMLSVPISIVSIWETTSAVPTLYYCQVLCELFGKSYQELGIPEPRELSRLEKDLGAAHSSLLSPISKEKVKDFVVKWTIENSHLTPDVLHGIEISPYDPINQRWMCAMRQDAMAPFNFFSIKFWDETFIVTADQEE